MVPVTVNGLLDEGLDRSIGGIADDFVRDFRLTEARADSRSFDSSSGCSYLAGLAMYLCLDLYGSEFAGVS
jgi:hypothetical protein